MSNAANTIYEQLGGRKFLVMTGAKEMVSDDNSLQFRLPRAAQRINRVVITVDDTDTYTVAFYSEKFRPTYKVTKVAEVERVPNENLPAVFTRHTELYTSL